MASVFRQRWLVRGEGGFDLGPFTVDEIKQRILDGRFGLTTEVCPESSGGWTALGDVPPLKNAYEKAQEELRLLEEHRTAERVEQTVRRKHHLASRGSQIVLVSIVLLAAAVAVVLATHTERTPCGYATSLYYETELGRIQPMASFAGERAHAWRFGADPPLSAPRQTQPRRPRRVAFGGELYEDDGGEPLIIDFDLTTTAPDGQALRKVSRDILLAEIQPRAERLLAPCLEAEAAERPEVGEATFRFDVLPTGRIGRARAVGPFSGRMHNCVRTSMRRLQIEPFAGTPLSMRISLRVNRTASR